MRFVRLFFVCFLFLSLPAGYRHFSKGFRIDKLLIPSQRGSSQMSEETQKLLAQDFHYLAQGTQSYVFKSDDGQYVLKLFRFEQTRNFIYRFIRTKVRGKPLRFSFEKQRERLFSACQIAHQLAQEETALVAIHLEKTDQEYPLIHLWGPMRKKWNLSLDRCCFAIQKMGEPIFSSLYTTLKKGDSDQMKRKFDSFHTLLKSRAAKGIVNLDSNLHRNFGFIGEKAIEIDFGAYYLVSKEEADKDVQFFEERFRSWLKKRMGEWVFYWEEMKGSDWK